MSLFPSRFEMWALAALGLVLCATGAVAESRGTPYTPAQLLEQSTLVVKGVVLEVETVSGYEKTFPTKASVQEVLKGRWSGKEIAFQHKHPGRNVIFEREFNKPTKGENGTFYLREEGNALVLIGYIKGE